MRTKIRIPRILKINWVEGLMTSVVFNNGESRTIDFKMVLQDTVMEENSRVSLLFNPDEFGKVKLQNNTLSWSNVEQFITHIDGQKKRVPYEIGADVLYEYSQPEEFAGWKKVGQLIRNARLESGLTQQQLASISGTTRNYISRIENERSDIELSTLWKIIETGLGKHLEIVIKPGVSSNSRRISKKVRIRKVQNA